MKTVSIRPGLSRRSEELSMTKRNKRMHTSEEQLEAVALTRAMTAHATCTGYGCGTFLQRLEHDLKGSALAHARDRPRPPSLDTRRSGLAWAFTRHRGLSEPASRRPRTGCPRAVRDRGARSRGHQGRSRTGGHDHGAGHDLHEFGGRRKETRQALGAAVDVEARSKLRALGGDADGAVVRIADPGADAAAWSFKRTTHPWT